MKIYVAGKITGLARQAVLDKFGKAGETLAKQGKDMRFSFRAYCRTTPTFPTTTICTCALR